MQEEAPEHLEDLDPHFSNQFPGTFTLEPLRSDGADALSVRGIDGIPFRTPTLRELEIHFHNALHEIFICKSDDFFRGAGGRRPRSNPIPLAGTLVRASFDLPFLGEATPRILDIRLPNLIQLQPRCDLRLLWPWLRTFTALDKIAKVLVILAMVCICSDAWGFELADDYDDQHHRCSNGLNIEHRTSNFEPFSRADGG